MSGLIRRVVPLPASQPWDDPEHAEVPESREWMVTNGLGGYASGTLTGTPTRKYHGLLVAALPAPLGRTVLLNHLEESVRGPSGCELRLVRLGEDASGAEPLLTLDEMRLEDGLPCWRFAGDGLVLERRLWMPHEQNITVIEYRNLGAPLTLRLRPWVHFRRHSGTLGDPPQTYRVERGATAGECLLTSDDFVYPVLRLGLRGVGASLDVRAARIARVRYAVEAARGYEAFEDLQQLLGLECRLERGAEATLLATVAGADPAPETIAREVEIARRQALLSRAALAGSPFAAELTLAADQFLVRPAYRSARAAVSEQRTIIAGYPWFTDWGRDAMISLEGLTLTTGRLVEARQILLTFAASVRDGLIPNLFPEGDQGGLYHTADATLWFFHAVQRYVDVSSDRAILGELLPVALDIIEHHFRGTRFGIGVDPADGLLRQGAPAHPLTWMDAKVGDLIVTPRRGKAVEINALFYNALSLLSDWLRFAGRDAKAEELAARAAETRASFNRRFWRADLGYLMDVVDAESGGDDASFRPNQVLAVALPRPVLDEPRWAPVVEAVRARLLTSFGLRSLAPGEPGYQPKYFGDLRARDLAYHQGTVWAWLIGPFVDAWLKVHPGELAEARGFLAAFRSHLGEACIGSISEIFDADPPFTARGCYAQAWSVAEVLRCLVKVGGGRTRPVRESRPSQMK